MFGGKKEEGRFVEVYKNGEAHHYAIDIILKDTVTGVLYLERSTRVGTALTLLTDADGKPLVDAVEK